MKVSPLSTTGKTGKLTGRTGRMAPPAAAGIGRPITQYLNRICQPCQFVPCLPCLPTPLSCSTAPQTQNTRAQTQNTRAQTQNTQAKACAYKGKTKRAKLAAQTQNTQAKACAYKGETKRAKRKGRNEKGETKRAKLAGTNAKWRNQSSLLLRQVLAEIFNGFDLHYDYVIGRYRVDYFVAQTGLVLECNGLVPDCSWKIRSVQE